MLAPLIPVGHVVCDIDPGGYLPWKLMVLVILLDLLQGLADELISREALVGVSVSKHRLHAPANRETVIHAERIIIHAERITTLGPRVRKHVCSKASLDNEVLLAIWFHSHASVLGLEDDDSLLAVLKSLCQNANPWETVLTSGCNCRRLRLEPISRWQECRQCLGSRGCLECQRCWGCEWCQRCWDCG